MKPRRALLVASAIWVVATSVWADNQICRVTAADGTVENGVGAEPGVVREFLQDLDVPSECQTLAGNTWVLAHELRVTRVNPSSPTVTASVAVRRLDPVEGVQPGQVFIEAQIVEVNTDAVNLGGRTILDIEWGPGPTLPEY